MQRPLPDSIDVRPLHRPTALLLAGAVLTGTACGPSGGGPMVGPDPGSMTASIPKDAIDLAMAPVTVAAGQELTVCQTARFPLQAPIDVTQISTRQSLSHHVIFYKYMGNSVPPVDKAPRACQPLDLLDGGPFKAPWFIGESTDPTQNVLKLPPGVAYHIEPTEYYMIEAHIVNASPRNTDVTINVYLTPAAPSSQVQYADMLFYNNTKGLSKAYDGRSPGLPPNTKTTISPSFGVVSDSFKIFGLTTHQHRFGTGVTVLKAAGSQDPGTPLFTNTDWQHPSLFRLPDAEPLTFKSGEGLRWVCSYDNTSSQYVRFGPSGVTDEMCIIWGYYYPSAGFQPLWN